MRIIALIVRQDKSVGCIAAVGLTPAGGLTRAVRATWRAGITLPICDGLLFSLLQSIVPPQMQGRVCTLLQSRFSAAPLLGLAFAGPVADRLGVQAWYLLSCAAVQMAVTALGIMISLLAQLLILAAGIPHYT